MAGPNSKIDLVSLESHPAWILLRQYCERRRQAHLESVIPHPDTVAEVRGRVMELDETIFSIEQLVQEYNNQVGSKEG